MKVLVLLAIVFVAFWLWGGNRRGLRHRAPADTRGDAPGGASGGARRASGTGVQEMVACAVCGLHVPRGEAVEGRGGRLYCGAEHRRTAEG